MGSSNVLIARITGGYAGTRSMEGIQEYGLNNTLHGEEIERNSLLKIMNLYICIYLMVHIVGPHLTYNEACVSRNYAGSYILFQKLSLVSSDSPYSNMSFLFYCFQRFK